jgi:hypothetical protein
MKISSLLIFVGLVCCYWLSRPYAESENLKSSPSSVRRQILSLSLANNGQNLTASVGDRLGKDQDRIAARRREPAKTRNHLVVAFQNRAKHWLI